MLSLLIYQFFSQRATNMCFGSLKLQDIRHWFMKFSGNFQYPRIGGEVKVYIKYKKPPQKIGLGNLILYLPNWWKWPINNSHFLHRQIWALFFPRGKFVPSCAKMCPFLAFKLQLGHQPNIDQSASGISHYLFESEREACSLYI